MRLTRILTAALAVLALGVLSACGEEEELEVIEGEPLELGEMSYNVQITRFLNVNDTEDAGYLEGQDDAPVGEQYLASFIRIENHGEETETIPTDIHVEDTRGNVYEPLDTTANPFGLDLGSELAAEGTLPRPDSVAASGAIKGAMLLFLVEESASENRPLELIIPGPDGEHGSVELDL